jgi:hypothetical protein
MGEAEALDAVVGSVTAFKNWLERSGRGYLAEGVDAMPVGDGQMEIFRRAGVRGIGPKDSIIMTLPLAQTIIAMRCKPSKSQQATS